MIKTKILKILLPLFVISFLFSGCHSQSGPPATNKPDPGPTPPDPVGTPPKPTDPTPPEPPGFPIGLLNCKAGEHDLDNDGKKDHHLECHSNGKIKKYTGFYLSGNKKTEVTYSSDGSIPPKGFDDEDYISIGPKCYTDTSAETEEACSMAKHACHESSLNCLSPAAAKCTNADHDTNGDGKKDYSTTCHTNGKYASFLRYGWNLRDGNYRVERTYYESGNRKAATFTTAGGL